MTEATAAALPQLSTATAVSAKLSVSNIRPLGDQIIIRLIQPEQVGSIIVPDSAKRITHQGEDNSPGSGSEELQYVNRWFFEDMTETMKRFAAAERSPGILISDADRELLKDLVFRANRALLPKNTTGIIPQNGAGLNFVEAEVVAVGPGRRTHDPQLHEDLVSFVTGFFAGNRLSQREGAELLERASVSQRIPLSVKVGNHVWYHPAVQRYDRQIDLGDGETYFIIREESVLAVLGEE